MKDDAGRRGFVKGVGCIVAGALAAGVAGRIGFPLPAIARGAESTPSPGGTTLCRLATARGLLYGAAAPYGRLSSDTAFAELIAAQCSILAPESELKWECLRPSPGSYDFTRADWMADFARRHDMLVCGHVLVWHEALPAWFPEVVTRQNAGKMMREHIAAVAGRYAGRMHSWDVVNEAVAVWDKRADGLRDSPWLKLLGPGYIAEAFHAAAEADPKAMLVLNQNHLEYDDKQDNNTRDATLRLLGSLKKEGVPLHALGVQAHLRGDEELFDAGRFRDFLRAVAGLGLKILITELDVDDQKLPADTGVRDGIVAKRYAEFLAAALSEPAVVAVMTWGLSDRSTWLASYKPRPDRLPVRPLPFDGDLRPTPAWYAMAKAFDNAPYRK